MSGSTRTCIVTCELDDPRWLRLVSTDPAATPFHLPAWARAVTDTYGYRGFVLAQRAPGGELTAGIPVVELRNGLGARRLVALPFTDHCPPLTRHVDEGAHFAGLLRRWREAIGADVLELRSELPVTPGAHPEVVGSRHLVALEPDSGAVRSRFHRHRVERHIRKALELGLDVTMSRARSELATFYDLHCRTRKRLGVPVQPRRFIEHVWERLVDADNAFVVVARASGKPVAAALFLSWNGHLIYKYGASDSAYWKLRANFLVFWTAIRWGCANGCRSFDFGRTDAGNQTLREFKASWGSTEVPLVYTHLGSSPRRHGHGLASRALARLIRASPPLVCRAAGEMLYRYAA